MRLQGNPDFPFSVVVVVLLDFMVTNSLPFVCGYICAACPPLFVSIRCYLFCNFCKR